MSAIPNPQRVVHPTNMNPSTAESLKPSATSTQQQRRNEGRVDDDDAPSRSPQPLMDVTDEVTETARHDEKDVLVQETPAHKVDLSSPGQAIPAELADMGIRRISTMPMNLVLTTASEFKSPRTQNLANEALNSIQHVLLKRFQNPDPSAATTIEVKLLKCNQGNRMARIFCSEFGVRWIVLELGWSMTQRNGNDKTTTTTLVPQQRIKLRDSAAIGSSDVCDEQYGHRTLVYNMCVEAATKIKNQATHALLQTEKF